MEANTSASLRRNRASLRDLYKRATHFRLAGRIELAMACEANAEALIDEDPRLEDDATELQAEAALSERAPFRPLRDSHGRIMEVEGQDE